MKTYSYHIEPKKKSAFDITVKDKTRKKADEYAHFLAGTGSEVSFLGEQSEGHLELIAHPWGRP